MTLLAPSGKPVNRIALVGIEGGSRLELAASPASLNVRKRKDFNHSVRSKLQSSDLLLF
jgi:hypothetical protein